MGVSLDYITLLFPAYRRLLSTVHEGLDLALGSYQQL